jgi:hypothetical protein
MGRPQSAFFPVGGRPYQAQAGKAHCLQSPRGGSHILRHGRRYQNKRDIHSAIVTQLAKYDQKELQ